MDDRKYIRNGELIDRVFGDGAISQALMMTVRRLRLGMRLSCLDADNNLTQAAKHGLGTDEHYRVSTITDAGDDITVHDSAWAAAKHLITLVHGREL
jgi:hypothetical protein